MKVISSNIRGLGNLAKNLAVRDIIKQESPSIVFLQETKLEEVEIMKATGNFWRDSLGSSQSSRGASRGLGIFWLNKKLTLVDEIKTKSWIMALLEDKVTGERIPFINIYGPVL